MRLAPHLSIIVPVYNGAARLPASLDELRTFACLQPFATELVLVDDHSAPDTQRLLERFACEQEGARLLRNEVNRGKGFSVARGMLAAAGTYRVFTDADLAYPATEIEKIVADLEGGADVAIACRVLPESRYVMSPSFFSYLYTRHVMSRAFNALVRHTLIPDVLDTQAGLKGFSARAAETVFSRLTVPRFGFDVEALYIARKHGLRLAQTPVVFRYLDEPTTVKFVKDAVQMARDLLHIRHHDWRGGYD